MTGLTTVSRSARRYDPTRSFKPQWAYATPPGFRDEVFLVPFQFSVLANGLLQVGFPWRLDDDVPYIIRGIVFPEIGTGQSIYPALARLTDTQGNPMSPTAVLPVLSLGAWAQSGFGLINAFGFPVEPEIVCAPGGSVIFDFLLSSNSVIATLILAGAAAQIEFFSTVNGAAGNATTISLVDTGVANTPLSVAVAGSAITVTLQDNGAGTLVTTYAQLAAAIAGNPAAAALVTSLVTGANPAEVLTSGVNAGAIHLSGGAAATMVPLQGTLIGVKRFQDC